jgi:hypothetical protein
MSRIPAKVRARVRRDFRNRCAYCQLPQIILSSKLEIEHIEPKAEGGTDDEENLCLACRDCNGFKSYKVEAFDDQTKRTVKLFNPRTQIWNEHFEFSQDKAKIIGKTACGRATVTALRMNNEQAVNARKFWVAAGWYPPTD